MSKKSSQKVDKVKACEKQKKIVEKRIQHLNKTVTPAEQALQDRDDIPAHNTDDLDKATFIDTLHYLEAVRELEKAKAHYASKSYQVHRFGTFLLGRYSHMDKAQNDHLAILQARINGFKPENKAQQIEIVQTWQQDADINSKCEQWLEKFRHDSQQLHRRKDEQEALKERGKELEVLSKQLSLDKKDIENCENPVAFSLLKTKVNQDQAINSIDVLCAHSPRAQKANVLTTTVSANCVGDGFKKNGLPSLGEHLDQFDKRLPPRIKEINRGLEHMRDLQEALRANPICPHLKQEFDECYSTLKENTEELAHIVKEYENTGILHLLAERECYIQFSLRLTNLYNTMTRWYQSNTMLAIPSKEHFANLKDKCPISVFNMMGELEPATDPRTQQALNITNAVFNSALQKYTANDGKVKITKKFNGDTVYEFESQAAKQAFISMALSEQVAEDHKKQKEQQEKQQDKSKNDVVAAREEAPSLGRSL
jgi:hypothetical protein